MVYCFCGFWWISIHSPLAGRDVKPRVIMLENVISIHSPLAGRDASKPVRYIFLDISIHSPLAGRDLTMGVDTQDNRLISIHSPLAGRDPNGTGGMY